MKSMKHGLLAAVATTALVVGAGAFAQSPSAPSNSELQSGENADAKAEKNKVDAKADAKADTMTNAQTPMKDSGASAQGGTKVEGKAQVQDSKQDSQPRGQAQETKQPSQTQRDAQPGSKPSQAQDSKKTDSKTSVQTESKTSGSSGSVQLDEQQRSKISMTLKQKDVNVRRVSRSEINFTINVGAAVPRTVTLYPLPAPIVAVVPAYRGYLYIVVDDQMLIIHPRTYEIVAVIPA
jgi:hypothetical protein